MATPEYEKTIADRNILDNFQPGTEDQVNTTIERWQEIAASKGLKAPNDWTVLTNPEGEPVAVMKNKKTFEEVVYPLSEE